MGVTSRRIAFACLVLAAALVPLRARRQQGPAQAATDQQARLTELHRRQLTMLGRWTFLSLRDSIANLPQVADAGGGTPAVLLKGFSREDSSANSVALVSSIWRRIATPDARVDTRVIVFNPRLYDGFYAGAFVSRLGDKIRCVAIVPGRTTFRDGTTPTHQVRAFESSLSAALGPCVLFATFGIPGPTVSAWLTETRYVGATSSDWLTRPRSFRDPYGPWVAWPNSTDGQRDPYQDVGGIFKAMGRVLGAVRSPPYEYGAAGVQCITGVAESCVTGVLHSALTPIDPDYVPAEFTQSGWNEHPDTVTTGTVRPPEPTYLSGIINAFGRERFQKFWNSTLPFEQAFQDAFGEPLGPWTARWSRDKWEGTFRAKFGGAEIALGTRLDGSWLPLIVVWSGLFVLIAMRVAERRRAR